ncbi:MAG: hypothetical protein JW864_06530 [Spirochaetes bacterium]|nr:hypothetical protein [Spirochaetota bacterium]
MKKVLDYTSMAILILMGALHTLLTPVLAVKFKVNPEDFAAIGLMFIFIGFINVSRIRTEDKILYLLCILTNLIGIAWLVYSFLVSESFAQGILPFIALVMLLIISADNLKHLKQSKLVY